jgi:uncharacterized iron-regulated protein
MPDTFLPKVSLILCIIFTLTGCSITHVMRIKDREVIGVETMIGELRNSPLVFVGERHDAASHHQLQLDIIKGLKTTGKPLAIGMEMFEGASQSALDAWSAGKVPEQVFRKVFEENWRNIPWGLYEEILLYARDNRIPVVALNAPRLVVQKVSQHGFASLSSGDLRLLPPGLSAEVSDSYVAFIGSSYPDHGRSGEAFRKICEAQMLRNRVMARRVADYLALHPESTMIVLAGGGHARKEGGIPSELGELPYRIVLPPYAGMTSKTATEKDADYLLEEPYSSLELLF